MMNSELPDRVELSSGHWNDIISFQSDDKDHIIPLDSSMGARTLLARGFRMITEHSSNGRTIQVWERKPKGEKT